MKVSPSIVKEIYDNDNAIWPKEDKWHFYTRNQIEKFINLNEHLIQASAHILNIGSGGESYGIPDSKTMHIDIAASRIKRKPHKLIMDLNDPIPLEEGYSDLIICVGSVLNYIDMARAIRQFSFLSKKGSHLILEFETSDTLELAFSGKMGQNALIIKTFYRNKESIIWYYSQNLVTQSLNEYGFEIIAVHKWHRLSPLLLKVTNRPNFSQWFCKFDIFLSKIPFFKKYSSNIILLAKKVS